MTRAAAAAAFVLLAVLLLAAGVRRCAQNDRRGAAVPGPVSVEPGRLPVEERFAALCADCHGRGLEGGRAPGLLALGLEDDAIAAAIRDGREGTPMPAFGGAIDDADIRALVVYLREAREEEATRGHWASRALEEGTIASERHHFRLETVAAGLDTPWGLAFLPDGRLLVTERPGRLRLVDRGVVSPPVRGTPPVHHRQDGGLLDVEIDPDFAVNGWIYLSLSVAGTGGASATAVVRGRIHDGAWVDEEHVYRPAASAFRADDTHYGSRLTFGPDGHLFYSIGDRGLPAAAGDLSRAEGKIHRVWPDGRIPDDNPFAGTSGALGSIWSYGNRNAQGLAWHPATGDLWETEHGPRGGDELNVIAPGADYGWPFVTHGLNYDGTPISDRGVAEGVEPPVHHWTPSIGVSAAAFYTGDWFPRWAGHLFVAALGYQDLRRLELDGRRVVREEVLFRQMGRVRDVAAGPDGYLYVALNHHDAPGRIVRLVPAGP